MRMRKVIAWLPGVGERPPTDFELLRAIWERHRDEFDEGIETRQTAPYLPIDIPAIAADLGVHDESVFGRLYHHLDSLYGQETSAGGGRKALFTPKLGPDVAAERNCINFPLLEAVLAGLWERRNRERWTLSIAIVSLVIAVGSLLVSVT
jgi:hypothetical protein